MFIGTRQKIKCMKSKNLKKNKQKKSGGRPLRFFLMSWSCYFFVLLFFDTNVWLPLILNAGLVFFIRYWLRTEVLALVFQGDDSSHSVVVRCIFGRSFPKWQTTRLGGQGVRLFMPPYREKHRSAITTSFRQSWILTPKVGKTCLSQVRLQGFVLQISDK